MQIKPKSGSSSKSTPDRLGDYELLAELAHDPFGHMSAARSISGQGAYDVVDVVALRTIQPSAWVDAWLVEDICQAAWGVKGQILSHVLPVTDVIVADGRVGVVTDYSEGEFLRSLLRLSATRRIPFPVGVGLRIALDTLLGLNSVQQAVARKPELSKLICGGLTADRLLVGVAGEAEIAEVVLSGKVAVKPVLAHDDDALGYRAPEHYMPDGEPDIRSDLFVVGICLWEMLANRALFVTADPKGQAAKGLDAPTVQAVLQAPIPKLSAPSIPAALADVVAQALARDPGARFTAPMQFKEAIEAAAKASIGTTADVARFVEQVAGQALASRKALIHKALRLSDPGGVAMSPAPGAIKVKVPAGTTASKAEAAPPSNRKPVAQESPKPAPVKAVSPQQPADPPRPGAQAKIARPGGAGMPRPKQTLLGMPAIKPLAPERPAEIKPPEPARSATPVANLQADADKPTPDDAAAPAEPANAFEAGTAQSVWGDAAGAAPGKPAEGEAPAPVDDDHEEGERLGSMDFEMMEAAEAMPPPLIKLADGTIAGSEKSTTAPADSGQAGESPADPKPAPAESVAAALPGDDDLSAAPPRSKKLWIAAIAGAVVLAGIVGALAMSGSSREGSPAVAAAASSAPTQPAAPTVAPTAEPTATEQPVAAADTPPAASSAAAAVPPPEPEPTAAPGKPSKPAATAAVAKPAPTAAATAQKKPPTSKPPAKKFKPTGI